jgi:hypothetical protein
MTPPHHNGLARPTEVNTLLQTALEVKWRNDVKTDPKDAGCNGMDWIHLA